MLKVSTTVADPVVEAERKVVPSSVTDVTLLLPPEVLNMVVKLSVPPTCTVPTLPGAAVTTRLAKA